MTTTTDPENAYQDKRLEVDGLIADLHQKLCDRECINEQRHTWSDVYDLSRIARQLTDISRIDKEAQS